MFDELEFATLNFDEHVNKIFDLQRNKTPKDWYVNITKTCPEFHYQESIEPKDFETKLTKTDLKVLYHFRSVNEIRLLAILEDNIIPDSAKIKVYADIRNKYKLVKTYCQKHNIKFKESTKKDIPYIELKYKDFLKCENLKPTVSDLLC